jgi:hypothetical protein
MLFTEKRFQMIGVNASLDIAEMMQIPVRSRAPERWDRTFKGFVEKPVS